MRSACICIAIVTLAASSAWPQGNPIGAAAPQAPIGHRQPTVKDLPPDVARDEKPVDGSRGEPQPESVSPRGKNVRARADGPSRGQNVRASAGGPPPLNVGPSCDAASRGAVIRLGTAEVVKIVGMAGSRVKGPVIGPMVFAENSRLQHGAGLHWLN